MLKRELVAGAVIVIAFACFAATSAVDVVTRQSEYFTPAIPPNTQIASLMGWLVTLYSFGLIAFGVWLVVRRPDRFKQFMSRFTITAVIPGHFLLSLLPASLGITLIFLMGELTWGLWLAFLSIPATLIFLWATIRSRSDR